MSKKKEEASTEEQNDMQFMVMPGADAPDDDDAPALDLSFEEVAEEKPEEIEPEAEVAESEAEETAESEDETEAEAESEAEVEEEAEEPAESEAEAEETAEVEEEPAKPEPETAKKSPMVPKARLDEVLAKQKALQKQLDEINAASQKSEEAPEEYDFDTKETEYQNMVLDGETDKAVALRREIRQAERKALEFEMRQEMNQTVNQDRQMTALQQAANAMEEAYPVFDRNAESFNEEYTNEVIELRDAFIMKGYEAVDALGKAVKYVVKDHELDAVDSDAPTLSQSAVKTDELSKKRAQVNKKLKAAEAQPPELPGESSSQHGEKSIDLSTMTEEEFDALPEATLKRLRGDIL